MGELSTLHRCTLGGVAFQLEDFRWEEEPVLRSSRRDGTRVAVEGIGWLEAGSMSALAIALAAAATSLRASGQDLLIYGPGDVVLYQLLAAHCVGGGPHLRFTVEPGLASAWGTRRVTFSAVGETTLGGGEDDDKDESGADKKTAVGPDTLKVVTWAGDFAGVGLDGKFSALRTQFIAQFSPPSRWVVTHEFAQNAKGDKGVYNLVATQLVDDLPGALGGVAVAGSASITTSRDDQMRLTKTYAYDLLVEGSVEIVLGIIRPRGLILHEVVEVEHYARRRVRATFVTLEGGNSNALMNWQASFHYVPEEPVYDVKRYANTLPVLIRRSPGITRLTYSGSATGAGVFIPPPARAATMRQLEPPAVNYTHVNEVEKRTDWQYVWALEEELPLALLARPVSGPQAPVSPLAKSEQRHPPLPGVAE